MKKIFLALVLLLINISIFAKEPVLTKIGKYKCGKQPKQVLFSPDSKYIIMPLLEDDGFDIFDVDKKEMLPRINPPNSSKLGYCEGLFIPEKKVFLVSQMTTGNLYEYSYPDFELKRTIPTNGTWSKFIAYSPEKNLLAVSNWLSNSVTLIDYETGTLKLKLRTGAAPRGLYYINDGEEIISLAFDGGVIEKFNTSTGKKLNTISIPKSAMRHIVMNDERTKAYISDMYFSQIYEVDIATFKITKKTKVYINPNTIDLLNNKWLFVSSRGPNNPQDYTKRSPSNGKIQIIDIETMEIVQKFEGGNQPTGLDVSDDGKLLCFSNFQDQNIEIYSIEE